MNKKPLPPPRAPQPFNRQQAQSRRPGVLQLKNQRPGVIQRMGWAILDSGDNNEHTPAEVVRTNLANAQRYYTRTPSEVSIDPTITNVQRVNLQQNEALHIHAHARAEGMGNFSAASLAALARAKFGANGLRGRTILLHGCNIGSGAFLNNFLRDLAENLGDWEGTRVFGPTNYLIVNKEGISQVARKDVKATELKTRLGQRGNVQKRGEGWKGVEVKNGAIKDIPAVAAKALVIRAMKKQG